MINETTYQILEDNKPIISGVKLTQFKLSIPLYHPFKRLGQWLRSKKKLLSQGD
jgi:hypothetical protein